MPEIVGAVLLPPVTVSTNVSLADNAPSLTVTVMVVVPLCPAAGVTVTVRLEPLPANTMFAFGASAGLEDVPLSVRAPTAVSASLTVKEIAGGDAPMVVDWSAMLLMDGGVLPGVVGGKKVMSVVM